MNILTPLYARSSRICHHHNDDVIVYGLMLFCVCLKVFALVIVDSDATVKVCLDPRTIFRKYEIDKV